MTQALWTGWISDILVFRPVEVSAGGLRPRACSGDSPDAVPDLLRDGLQLSLSPNMSVAIEHGPISVPAGIKWGGKPEASTEAMLKIAGQKDVLLAMDGLPFLPPDKQKAAIMEIVKRRQACG
jgi:hypothetical protein